MFSNKSMEEVYDMAATKNDYDSAIRYERRKIIFKELLSPYDFKNKSVLDLACGTGVFLDAIETNQLKKVVGVDISQQMLAKAKTRLSRFKNLELKHESFMNLEKFPGKFDFILMANASRFITQGKEKEFFQEISQKLNPVGLFIITTDYLFSDNAFGKTIVKLMQLLRLQRRYNPQTAWTWEVEKLLQADFEIIHNEKYRYWDLFIVKHKFIVCKAK